MPSRHTRRTTPHARFTRAGVALTFHKGRRMQAYVLGRWRDIELHPRTGGYWAIWTDNATGQVFKEAVDHDATIRVFVEPF